MNQKIKFTLFIIVCALVGGLFGYFVAGNELNIKGYDFRIMFDYDMIYSVFALIMIITIISLMLRIKKLTKENDPLFLVSGISVITGLTWLALAFAQLFHTMRMEASERILDLVFGNLVVALILFFTALFLQSYLVRTYNKKFPKKNLDLFAKKPMESYFAKLDEGEKWVVYQASFKSFVLMEKLLMFAILLFSLYSIFFELLLFPIIICALIWTAQKTHYVIETKKFE